MRSKLCGAHSAAHSPRTSLFRASAAKIAVCSSAFTYDDGRRPTFEVCVWLGSARHAHVHTHSCTHMRSMPGVRSHSYMGPAAHALAKCARARCGTHTVIHTQIEYDKAIVAVGEQPATFGVKGVREHCFFMKGERNDMCSEVF
jgi:hypothetical protein